MIFPNEVKAVAEKFLTDTLKKWPKMVDALLSHPKWDSWCASVADELTKQQIIAEVEDKPFNPVKEVTIWAASYAQHALDSAEDKYFGSTAKEIQASEQE